MKKITLEDILDPITIKTFFTEYWGKKHLVIRRNKFKNLFTWNDFNNMLNRYPDIKGLQIIKDHGRWCLDKVRKGKMKAPMLSKEEVYQIWAKGNTFVLPFSEYENKDLVDISFAFERYFGPGYCNVYASPRGNSKSFPAHADQTENFLFHTEGQTKWTIYEEFAPLKKGKPEKILDEFILDAGDLLYIPQFQFHMVETIGPRILCSVHFHNKDKQSLSSFRITTDKENKRNKWYNWVPQLYYGDDHKKIDWPKMQSDHWKKKLL
jgi:oxalate decarboxylase/phosphoglucose isomerase-like protein (cupin superfamily)|tara:strand:+ start:974 stop:1768 length:795 start_codon:yes stop_codon:yes gene_type:complete